MSKSVYLYLVSGVSKGIAFWLVDFTEEEDIFNYQCNTILECYRKELFGLESAIEVKNAINITLEILSNESKFEQYKLEDNNKGYSSEIPINIMEDIFDLWAYNYKNHILWQKYLGLLKFRRKLKKNNNYICLGLKGPAYEFAYNLNRILSFTTSNSIFKIDHNKDLMW